MVQRPNLSISHREQIYSPALPRLFSSKRQLAAPLRKSFLPDILQDIKEAGCVQYSPKACD